MTKKTLDRMPESVRMKLERFRAAYRAEGFAPKHYDETRARAAAYVDGLKDAGLINERERQILFIYTTI